MRRLLLIIYLLCPHLLPIYVRNGARKQAGYYTAHISLAPPKPHGNFPTRRYLWGEIRANQGGRRKKERKKEKRALVAMELTRFGLQRKLQIAEYNR
jgi:hypothetical protein